VSECVRASEKIETKAEFESFVFSEFFFFPLFEEKLKDMKSLKGFKKCKGKKRVKLSTII
jgi:hypothetical protein